jgi:hypothetical protein
VELVKDFVAIANSGRGVIVVGARSNGVASGADVSKVLSLDPAELTDKVYRYTSEHFGGFEIHDVRRGKSRTAAIVIEAVEDAPLVFSRVGTYPVGANQKTAFSQGTIYFRHGAKSEPATRSDLQDFIARRLEMVRESWLSGIRQVIAAPKDTEVALIQRDADRGGGTRIRLTTDPGAPVYGMVDPDDTHPFRQTELIEEVNKRLPKKARKITSHDIQCVRRVHNIHPETAPHSPIS